MSAHAYAYSTLVLKIFFFVLGVWHKCEYNLNNNTLTKVQKL